jgi:integrase
MGMDLGTQREGRWTTLTPSEKMELVERYKLLLASKRRSPRYVEETANQLHRLLRLMGWQIDEDLTVLTLARLRDDHGLSVRTTNKYAVQIKSLAKWLTRRGYFPLNPLQFVPLLNQKVDRRHERAAFTDEEIGKLLSTTYNSTFAYRGVGGRDRAAIYFCALVTGLREGTISQLRVNQFSLAPPAFLRVEAKQLKDAEDLTIPLPAWAAPRLSAYLRGKPLEALAFKVPPQPWDYVIMLRKDLTSAGIRYCSVEVLSNGRYRRKDVKDFHALRVSAATRWMAHGVPLAMAQRLLGHSDPAQTSRYTHPTPPDLRAAVDRLPPLSA